MTIGDRVEADVILQERCLNCLLLITPQTPSGDRDDFIVGHIRVHSDQKINKIGFHAGS